MLQRYLVALLLLFPVSAFSHPPYHHDLYYYPSTEHPNIIAQAHYVDGIVVNDPVSFKAVDHLGNIIVETPYVHTMAVFRAKEGAAYIFLFDSLLIPYSTEVLYFNGQSLTNITSFFLLMHSPVARLWYDGLEYLVAGLICTVPALAIFLRGTGKSRLGIILWWTVFLLPSFFLLLLIPMVIFFSNLNVILLLAVFLLTLGFELWVIRSWKKWRGEGDRCP